MEHYVAKTLVIATRKYKLVEPFFALRVARFVADVFETTPNPRSAPPAPLATDAPPAGGRCGCRSSGSPRAALSIRKGVPYRYAHFSLPPFSDWPKRLKSVHANSHHQEFNRKELTWPDS